MEPHRRGTTHPHGEHEHGASGHGEEPGHQAHVRAGDDHGQHAHVHADDHHHDGGDGHGQAHGHHGHHHHSIGSDARSRRRLTLTLGLITLYLVAEIVGGLLTNSLALLADAGHMFSDAAALALSLFAVWIAQRPATSRRSYGYYRAEILAALVNGATLIAVSIIIFLEAVERFRAPEPVQGAGMMLIAVGGLAINLVSLSLLSSGREGNLNMRGVWLHVLMDSLGSAQAIVAGALIWWKGWAWVDPLASVLIGLLVIYSSWSLLREATSVLMEATPAHIDPDLVKQALSAIDGVVAVHDLHVWTITSGLVSLSAHVQIQSGSAPREVLLTLQGVLRRRFNIDHTTLQLDTEGCDDCGLPV